MRPGRGIGDMALALGNVALGERQMLSELVFFIGAE
jgi:hypothetical protein